MGYLLDNPQFKSFQNKLREAGITLVENWSRPSAVDGHYVYHFSINGAPAGAAQTAIAIDYGRDGYGWYVETATNSIDGDVAALAQPMSRAA